MMAGSDAKKFKGWAEGNGGVVEPETSEFEIARIRYADGVFVVYQGRKGISFSDSVARAAWAAFKHGKGFPLARRQKRTKSEKTIARLADRDGNFCWFCGCNWHQERKPTIEHLLSICHGGSNNIANLVLACEPCNQRAGNLPVSQKLLLKAQVPA